jgi:signal transduction histidine kinase
LLIVQASNQRLQQCLDALIANALLYSEGPVQLRADLINDQVILHVLDSGPGIAFSEREHVLERFTRGSAAVDTQGTGLGLALVDQLVRAMGGDVRIAEAPGGGADLQLRFNRLTPPLEP